ncbi:serine-type peptidase [Rhypophila decipiens]|uniref:Serine-type peptidase n=1 Tax=Rhypophila decipiens TaxID=261697 RepID=A0AAN6Y9L0_9PEZI|nr:serine-type peptidase [Rhypophila decipiens]
MFPIMKGSYLAGGLATAISLAGNVANANLLFRHQSGMHIGLGDDHHLSLEKRNAIAKRYNGQGTFDQLLDHGNPKLGTFQQRFWYGTEYWKGPGYPVIVINPGETNAQDYSWSYTTNTTLPGRYAQENGAAIIIVEHRYWGGSSPFDVLTVQNLTYLTLENSLQDMVYFAKNFVPPFDTSGNSSSTNAPYIFLGGSYTGAIAHWLATLYPGEGFWAYHAVSAVVQAVGDFHNFFDPVFEYMPNNCSKDVTEVIDHIDRILLYGTAEEKDSVKRSFGFEGTADVDFAWALATPLMWFQTTQFSDGFNSIDSFCGFVENATGGEHIPGADGVGLEKALDGFARYSKYELQGSCGGSYAAWEGTQSCWDTQEASSPRYTDLSVNNLANRQWVWLLCNEPFEWWQTSTPRPLPTPNGTNGVISRLIDYESMRSWCIKFFPPPPVPNILLGKTFKDVNDFTKGGYLNINSPTKKLMHSNGALDPWRDATLASHVRPGGPLESTSDLPHFVIPGATHCADLFATNWAANEHLASIVDAECETLGRWIGQFYEQTGKTWPGKIEDVSGVTTHVNSKEEMFKGTTRRRRSRRVRDERGYLP